VPDSANIASRSCDDVSKAYLSALNKLSARRDRLHAQAAQSA
jgi:hypothetical protein